MSKSILIVLMLIVLNGCSIANYLRLKYENDNIQAQWSQNKNLSNVDADIDEKPYVFININGIDDFKMMLDTGASVSYLFDSIKVKKLSLKQGYDLELRGWGDGANSHGYQTEVSTITLGDVSFDNVSFAYLPVSQSTYFARADELVFDGIIGHDILKHFTWYIDAKTNQINISNQAYTAKKDDNIVPLDISFSKLYFDSKIDLGNGREIEQVITLDTGSRHHLKLNTYHLKEDNLMPATQAVTGADFGLSGQTIHQRTSIKSIEINELKLDKVKTNLINGDDDGHSVIGSAILNQYPYVIDYQKPALIIQRPQQVHYQSRYNLLGMELRQLLSGHFVVRYIMPDLAAAKTGIQQGDEVISIDGIPAKKMDQTAWLNRSNQPGTHRICVNRDKQCFEMNAKPLLGFSL